ncbi:TetR/AcrR family transcriptional regulator [Cumulibacter soli]|uniref:TetR/AcrR family transcriptional regulator n=1 Tax=Cumulibacter soli TaxID=2546344 RepID=UPI0010684BE9|nr:TetR/AcrR family transcriptional regulator [Cumulibacter soli]
MSSTTPARDWRVYGRPDLDAVLSAAVDAFNELGYHAATVRDIAGRCGLSVAGIYHHHAGKQEMLMAVLTSVMEELKWRNAAAREAGGDDPVQRFCNQVRALTLSHIYWQKPTAIGSTEMRSLEEPNRARFITMRAELQEHIQRDVDLAVEQGAFHTGHPIMAVGAVAGMCLQTAQWYSADGELSPEQIAQNTVDVALDIVAYRPN